jgi:hypothetical protein
MAAAYEVFHTSSGTNYCRQTDDDYVNVDLPYLSKGWTGRCELRIFLPTAQFWGLTVSGSVTFWQILKKHLSDIY